MLESKAIDLSTSTESPRKLAVYVLCMLHCPGTTDIDRQHIKHKITSRKVD